MMESMLQNSEIIKMQQKGFFKNSEIVKIENESPSSQRRDKFLKMAEEGKRNIRKGAEITHNKVWGTPTEVLPLSDVDKGNEEGLNMKPTEPSSEPKTKPEPRKPEKINVREARAKT